MKKTYAATGICLLASSMNTAWAAEDDVQFTFAPPPITSEVPEGGKVRRVTLTNIEVDLPDNPIAGNGVNFTSRTSRPESAGFDADYAKGGVMLMNDENDTMTVFSLAGGSGAEVYVADNPGHIFTYGFDLNITNFQSEFDFGSISTEVDSDMMSLGLSLGYQNPVYFQNGFAITPYVTYSYMYTQVNTLITTSGASYSSDTSEDSFTSGMATIGFDVTIPGGISLATLMSSGDNDDIRMLQLGFNF